MKTHRYVCEPESPVCQQWKHSGRGIPFDYNGIEFSSLNSSPESKPHGLSKPWSPPHWQLWDVSQRGADETMRMKGLRKYKPEHYYL